MASGKMAGFSTPFTGDEAAWKGDNWKGWASGGQAAEDLTDMYAPVQTDWNQHTADAAAFQTDYANSQQMGNAARGAYGGRQAPQTGAAQIDTAQQAEMRAQQTQLASALAAQAEGRGVPSLAEMQMRQGQDQNLRNSMAMAASQRGSGAPGMAMRQAQEQQAITSQQTAANAGQLRAQEQMAAQQQLAALSGQVRGQDIGLAGQQAGLNQQTALTNQQTMMQQQQQNDQMVQYYQSLGYSMDEANRAAAMEQQRMAAEQNAIGAQVAMADADRAQQSKAGLVGQAGSFLGAVFSDERLKENTSKGDGVEIDVGQFLDGLESSKFDYKSGKHGGKGNYGFMAQDAERSAMGRSMIIETDEGKAIDKNRALMGALTSVAHLNKRLRKLEGK